VLLLKRADVCTGRYIKVVDKPLGQEVICKLVAGNGQCFNTEAVLDLWSQTWLVDSLYSRSAG
jgi:hypothetical protein